MNELIESGEKHGPSSGLSGPEELGPVWLVEQSVTIDDIDVER